MQIRKAKFIMIIALLLSALFFSSDFGLIDVEKTSIITAVAVDKASDEYLVTAQIAVPEATDTNSENLKAQISGKGATVGEALKNLGDISGWFPKLSFCNLIILGHSLGEENVIKVLDYFAKTLRVQDSALVALAENTASELLTLATPLDNISAFAMQKILLKNTGFDRDVKTADVKTFCTEHYSLSSSSIMPIIKRVSAGSEENVNPSAEKTQSANSNQSGGATAQNQEEKDKDNLFDARTTALFKNGVKVGELDENQTLSLNALNQPFKGTTFPVKDVLFNGQNTNYLLTVLRRNSEVKVVADDNELKLVINLFLYCKVSDHSADNSSNALSQNYPIPEEVIYKAEGFFRSNLEELVMAEKQTECDLFRIKEKLYRFNHKQYSRYKDNFINSFKYEISVTVSGQK